MIMLPMVTVMLSGYGCPNVLYIRCHLLHIKEAVYNPPEIWVNALKNYLISMVVCNPTFENEVASDFLCHISL